MEKNTDYDDYDDSEELMAIEEELSLQMKDPDFWMND